MDYLVSERVFLPKVLLQETKYGLTSPYGHLYNTDTSVKRTLGSVPLVSVLKRFDCNQKPMANIVSIILREELLKAECGVRYD